MIVDFLKGKMFASVDTGLNIVHVRDVARGHILAAERGRVGERYILGHRNLSLLEIFRMLAALTGVRAPRCRVPYAVAWLAAGGHGGRRPDHAAGRPQVPLTAVRMARKRMYFSAAKAVTRARAAADARRAARSETRWPGSSRAAMRRERGEPAA